MGKEEPILVLLVEDEPAHAEIVKRNLAEFDIASQVIHLADGQMALDYLFRKNAYVDPKFSPRPSIVLLDLRLPKVDGLKVLEEIQKDPELKQIPTVVLTTSAAERDISQAYVNGSVSYLVKPVDFDKFTKMMKAFGFYWLTWNRFPEKE